MAIENISFNTGVNYTEAAKDYTISNPVEENEASIFDKEKEKNTEILEEQFKEVQNKQGFLGKLWNGIKNITNLGTSSEDVEETLEKYKNNEISFEEAQNKIKTFENKQSSAIDLITNVSSGLIVAGTATLTGGLSLAGVGIGAIAGGAAKAGIKTIDRATNEIKNDEFNAKEIIKDSFTGAVDGAVTIATAGMSKTTTFVGQSIKGAVKQGVVQGAKAGVISGAATGAANYSINAVLEENVEFDIGELLKTSAQNAAAGGIFGGASGGISSGLAQKKLDSAPVEVQIKNSAQNLHETYEKNVKKVQKEYEGHFGDLETVEKVSSRAKSTKSIYNKLMDKYKAGNLQSANLDDCAEIIGDGYGVRIQLKSLTKEETKEIVENTLQNTGRTYDDFINVLNCDEPLDEIYLTVLNNLKAKQTDEIIDRMSYLMENNKLILCDNEFNNYGTEITSYFTDRQLGKLSKAHYEGTNKPLDLVTKKDLSSEIQATSFIEETGKFETKTIETAKVSEDTMKKADKKSGYITTQGNAKNKYTKGTAELADIEFQIRGEYVNEFGEIEHIPYDIRKDKITINDTKYAPIYSRCKDMADESYSVYRNYIRRNYKHDKLKELGIEIDEAVMPDKLFYKDNGGAYSKEDLAAISREGLKDLINSHNEAKKSFFKFLK